MEFNQRFEEQHAALTAKLSKFPDVELASCGAHANSVKHWFHIRHIQSERCFSVDSKDASDFSKPYFISLLESFAEECKGGRR